MLVDLWQRYQTGKHPWSLYLEIIFILQYRITSYYGAQKCFFLDITSPHGRPSSDWKTRRKAPARATRSILCKEWGRFIWSRWLWPGVWPEELKDGEYPERNYQREEKNLSLSRVLIFHLISWTLSQVSIALFATTHSSLRWLPANLWELWASSILLSCWITSSNLIKLSQDKPQTLIK